MKRVSLLSSALLLLLLLSACGSKERVRNEVTIGKEMLNVMMPTGKDVVHPTHGKEVWFAVGAMSGYEKTNANGVAQAHVFADGASTATVNLNIQPAAKGMQYVAWLQKPGTTERIRLDALQNPLNDVRHVITSEIDKDAREFTEVIITLERTGSPADADPVQATGLLKHQER